MFWAAFAVSLLAIPIELQEVDGLSQDETKELSRGLEDAATKTGMSVVVSDCRPNCAENQRVGRLSMIRGTSRVRVVLALDGRESFVEFRRGSEPDWRPILEALGGPTKAEAAPTAPGRPLWAEPALYGGAAAAAAAVAIGFGIASKGQVEVGLLDDEALDASRNARHLATASSVSWLVAGALGVAWAIVWSAE